MNYLRVLYSSFFSRFCSFGLCKSLEGLYNGYNYTARLCACCAYRFASYQNAFMSNKRFQGLCDVIAFVTLLLVVLSALFLGNLQYQADLYQETHFGVLP